MIIRKREVLANRFADFFESKINVIKQDLTWKCAQLVNPLPDSSLPQCETTLDSLTPVTCEELAPLVKKISAKSCSLDPIPANVLKNSLYTSPSNNKDSECFIGKC